MFLYDPKMVISILEHVHHLDMTWVWS